MKKNDNEKIKQDLPPLDVLLLQSYIDSLGKSIVEQMFTLYKQQATIYLNDIKKAQLTDSIVLWQEHCHKMKGASASVGLTRLHSLLVKLEKTTVQQAEKAILFTELENENEKAIAVFKQWLAEVANINKLTK